MPNGTKASNARMNESTAKEAARLLASARSERSPLEALPESCRPQNESDAYRVQDALVELIDDDTFGWKVGATNEVAQQGFGISAPFWGRLLASRAIKSPATVQASNFSMCAIECEVAFVMDRDLPVANGPYALDDVIQAAGQAHPAIEIVDCRFNDFRSVGGYSVIADNGIDGGFVYGKAVRGWRTMELEAHSVSLIVNGGRVSQGNGAAVLGNPVNALHWLVNAVNDRGFDVRKGEFITTGSWTGIHMGQPGDAICADFGELGRIELRIAD